MVFDVFWTFYLRFLRLKPLFVNFLMLLTECSLAAENHARLCTRNQKVPIRHRRKSSVQHLVTTADRLDAMYR